jgi:hypothetical protein
MKTPAETGEGSFVCKAQIPGKSKRLLFRYPSSVVPAGGAVVGISI